MTPKASTLRHQLRHSAEDAESDGVRNGEGVSTSPTDYGVCHGGAS